MADTSFLKDRERKLLEKYENMQRNNQECGDLDDFVIQSKEALGNLIGKMGSAVDQLRVLEHLWQAGVVDRDAAKPLMDKVQQAANGDARLTPSALSPLGDFDYDASTFASQDLLKSAGNMEGSLWEPEQAVSTNSMEGFAVATNTFLVKNQQQLVDAAVLCVKASTRDHSGTGLAIARRHAEGYTQQNDFRSCALMVDAVVHRERPEAAFAVAEGVAPRDSERDWKILYVAFEGEFVCDRREALKSAKRGAAGPAFLDGSGHCTAAYWNKARSVPLGFFVQAMRKGHHIVLTGYGTAGAVAALVMLRLYNDYPGSADVFRRRLKCITFGAPLLCNSKFAEEVKNKILDSHFLFCVAHNDAIPRMKHYVELNDPLTVTDETGLHYVEVPCRSAEGVLGTFGTYAFFGDGPDPARGPEISSSSGNVDVQLSLCRWNSSRWQRPAVNCLEYLMTVLRWANAMPPAVQTSAEVRVDLPSFLDSPEHRPAVRVCEILAVQKASGRQLLVRLEGTNLSLCDVINIPEYFAEFARVTPGKAIPTVLQVTATPLMGGGAHPKDASVVLYTPFSEEPLAFEKIPITYREVELDDSPRALRIATLPPCEVLELGFLLGLLADRAPTTPAAFAATTIPLLEAALTATPVEFAFKASQRAWKLAEDEARGTLGPTEVKILDQRADFFRKLLANCTVPVEKLLSQSYLHQLGLTAENRWSLGRIFAHLRGCYSSAEELLAAEGEELQAKNPGAFVVVPLARPRMEDTKCFVSLADAQAYYDQLGDDGGAYATQLGPFKRDGMISAAFLSGLPDFDAKEKAKAKRKEWGTAAKMRRDEKTEQYTCGEGINMKLLFSGDRERELVSMVRIVEETHGKIREQEADVRSGAVMGEAAMAIAKDTFQMITRAREEAFHVLSCVGDNLTDPVYMEKRRSTAGRVAVGAGVALAGVLTSFWQAYIFTHGGVKNLFSKNDEILVDAILSLDDWKRTVQFYKDSVGGYESRLLMLVKGLRSNGMDYDRKNPNAMFLMESEIASEVVRGNISLQKKEKAASARGRESTPQEIAQSRKELRWEVLFGEHSLKFLRPTYRNLVVGWLDTVVAVHKMRMELMKMCVVGVYGATKSGKSTLIRKWGFDARAGGKMADITTAPCLYTLDKDLGIVDFPGKDDADANIRALHDRFKVIASINIAVVEWTARTHENFTWVRQLTSETSDLLVCLNKADTMLAEEEQELEDRPKPGYNLPAALALEYTARKKDVLREVNGDGPVVLPEDNIIVTAFRPTMRGKHTEQYLEAAGISSAIHVMDWVLGRAAAQARFEGNLESIRTAMRTLQYRCNNGGAGLTLRNFEAGVGAGPGAL